MSAPLAVVGVHFDSLFFFPRWKYQSSFSRRDVLVIFGYLLNCMGMLGKLLTKQAGNLALRK